MTNAAVPFPAKTPDGYEWFVMTVTDPATLDGGQFEYFVGTKAEMAELASRGETPPLDRVETPPFKTIEDMSDLLCTRCTTMKNNVRDFN